ncbi:hypothetical protein HK104_009053, partial [Borealophlyctis nickersoniae]
MSADSKKGDILPKFRRSGKTMPNVRILRPNRLRQPLEHGQLEKLTPQHESEEDRKPQKDHDNFWKRAQKLWGVLVGVNIGFNKTEKQKNEEQNRRWDQYQSVSKLQNVAFHFVARLKSNITANQKLDRSASGSGEWLKEGKMDIFQATIDNDLERLKQLDEATKISDPTYLHQKGAHGRTILHVACLYKHQDIIKYLVESDRHKALINATYGGVYYGEHAAHILVIHEDLEMLQLLVKHGADIAFPRATGSFFSPTGTVYFGETVLSFAACTGNEAILKYLLDECGADPMAIDSHGNTALHVLAWWGYYDTTKLAEIRELEAKDAENRDGGKEPEPSNAKLGGAYKFIQDRIKQTSENPHMILNYQRFTPMLVAVDRGHRHMVHALLEDTAISEWEFGVAICKSYPLTYLDRPATKAYLAKLDNTNSKLKDPSACALELAVRNQDTDLISGEPLFRMLLEAKWIIYSKDIFTVYFIGALIYAILFSLAIFFVAHVKDVEGTDRLDYFSGEKNIARFVVDVLLLIINVSRVVRELLNMRRSWRHYIFGFHGPNNLFLWANIFCFFLVFAFRLAKMVHAENVVLGLAALVVWVSLLHYTKASKRLGPLVMIFNRMIMWDLWRFMILWGVFFLGFAEALYLQMHSQGVSEADKEDIKQAALARNDTQSPDATATINDGLVDWNTPGGALMWMFRWSVGQASYDDLRGAINSKAAIFFWVVFTILITILLLNTFIAMLNTTYTKIIDHVDLRWHAEWAQVVLGIDEKLHDSAPLIGFRRTAPTSTSGSPSPSPASSSSCGQNGQYHFQLTFREGTNIPVSLVATEDLTDMGDKIRKSADARVNKDKALFGNLKWGAEEAPRTGRRGLTQMQKKKK